MNSVVTPVPEHAATAQRHPKERHLEGWRSGVRRAPFGDHPF